MTARERNVSIKQREHFFLRVTYYKRFGAGMNEVKALTVNIGDLTNAIVFNSYAHV